MVPTTKTFDGKFAPAIRIDRGDRFDLWVNRDYLLADEDAALKIAEKNVTMIGRSVTRQLIEGRYRCDDQQPR